MTKIDVYTQPWCPYCAKALHVLTQKGAQVNEIEAPHGTAEREQSIARSGGRTSVPQIFIGDRHIGGCDELLALDRAGQLDPLLAA